jgi:hypothetical protein
MKAFKQIIFFIFMIEINQAFVDPISKCDNFHAPFGAYKLNPYDIKKISEIFGEFNQEYSDKYFFSHPKCAQYKISKNEHDEEFKKLMIQANQIFRDTNTGPINDKRLNRLKNYFLGLAENEQQRILEELKCFNDVEKDVRTNISEALYKRNELKVELSEQFQCFYARQLYLEEEDYFKKEYTNEPFPLPEINITSHPILSKTETNSEVKFVLKFKKTAKTTDILDNELDKYRKVIENIEEINKVIDKLIAKANENKSKKKITLKIEYMHAGDPKTEVLQELTKTNTNNPADANNSRYSEIKKDGGYELNFKEEDFKEKEGEMVMVSKNIVLNESKLKKGFSDFFSNKTKEINDFITKKDELIKNYNTLLTKLQEQSSKITNLKEKISIMNSLTEEIKFNVEGTYKNDLKKIASTSDWPLQVEKALCPYFREEVYLPEFIEKEVDLDITNLQPLADNNGVYSFAVLKFMKNLEKNSLSQQYTEDITKKIEEFIIDVKDREILIALLNSRIILI